MARQLSPTATVPNHSTDAALSLRPRLKFPPPDCSEPATAWGGPGDWGLAGSRHSAGEEKPTAKLEAGTDRVLGCLGGEGLYRLWLLFITYKSFAFY